MAVSRIYCVGGYCFNLFLPASLLEKMENLSPFRCMEDAVSPESFLFELHEGELWPDPDELRILYCSAQGPYAPVVDIYQSASAFWFSFRPLPGLPIAAWLSSDFSFHHGELFLTGNDNVFGLNNALMLLYALSTAPLGLLEMHSSVVMHDGKGYLFLGKSGTGKSTHSRLWLQNIPDTELLNDDNPVLRLMPDGSARVFGTPWSGKTPCYKAQDVPVGAIVRIEQAPQNTILKLSPLESYASIMASASAFRPFKELSDGWHRTLEGLAALVPCYILRCLPDDAAAILCHKTVHG